MDREGVVLDALRVLPEISTAQEYESNPTGLAEFRLSQGLSRERLAARAGVSARTIYNLERGRCVPQSITQTVLARALRCRVKDIFPIPTNESSPPFPAAGSTKTAGDDSHEERYTQ
jgi:DNA-binding XRE family transcriptional regulator